MSYVRQYAREIGLFIGGLSGAVVITEYYVSVPALSAAARELVNWGTVIAAFAMGLGIFKQLTYHGGIVARREPGRWYTSLWLLALLVITIAIGLVGGIRHPVYMFLFSNIYYMASAAILSMLGFFIVAASFKAIKMRNVETTLLMISAVLVMLTRAPIGAAISKQIPVIGEWVQLVPSMAAYRGIIIGAGLGAILLGLRELMGLGTQRRLAV